MRHCCTYCCSAKEEKPKSLLIELVECASSVSKEDSGYDADDELDSMDVGMSERGSEEEETTDDKTINNPISPIGLEPPDAIMTSAQVVEKWLAYESSFVDFDDQKQVVKPCRF